jgi:hypothetical protein
MGPARRKSRRDFVLSATVDFPGDASHAVHTPELLSQMMAELKGVGVSRIYWIYYGEEDPDSYWAGDIYYNHLERNARESAKSLGNPLKAAVDAAHANGIEAYGVFKPYHTGISGTFPEGSDGADATSLKRVGGTLWYVSPIMERYPYLLAKRRPAALPSGVESQPVRRVRLCKNDDRPTRVGEGDLQLWTSPNNYRYQRLNVDFKLTESVEPAPRDVRDYYGETVTVRGAPVRTLTLDGLDLCDRFVVVTTGLTEGEPDFVNTPQAMVQAYGDGPEPLPVEVASLSTIWHRPRDFRTGGLEFDSGFGTLQVALDADNSPYFGPAGWAMMHRHGAVAFARGRNEYLPSMPCEMYPEMRRAWDGWVGFILDAGVDGIDVRISSHGNIVDDPFDYGYNEPVVDAFRKRHGREPAGSAEDRRGVAEIRGEYYTGYLREMSRRVRGEGRKLQFHLHTEAFRPDPTHGQIMGFPANLHFDWKTWLAEGLFDGATLRTSWFEAWEDPPGGVPDRQLLERALSDPVAQEAIAAANRAGVPLYLNRYVDRAVDDEGYVADLETVFNDGRLSGFDLYESANLVRARPDASGFDHVGDRVKLLRAKSRELGIL